MQSAACHSQPPFDILDCLTQYQLNHRPVLLSTTTDIWLAAKEQAVWLIVTADHLSVTADVSVLPSPIRRRFLQFAFWLVDLRRVASAGPMPEWLNLHRGLLQSRASDRDQGPRDYSNCPQATGKRGGTR